jgi:hypothetical protein
MARSKKSKFELQCRILQNGRPVKNYTIPYGENSHLYATGNGNDPLGITHYPLSRPISVVDTSKHGTYVEIDHPWEGFLLSEGEIIEVNGYHDLGKSFKITPGDFASLAWNDLRILLKIAPKQEEESEGSNIIPGKFRGSILVSRHSDSTDKSLMFMAIVAALGVIGAFVTGLQNRVHNKPDRFESLPLEYVAPFVSSDHIKTAPEALQKYLDREDYVGSIFRYYRSMSNVLLGQESEVSKSVFPSLVKKVELEREEVYEKHKSALQLKTIEEEKALSIPGTSLIAIPAVEMKSHRETTLALIERIYQLHESFEYTLEQKRSFLKTFKSETGYNWQDYERKQKIDRPDRGIFAGASRGFRKVPKEEAMYVEAQNLADSVEMVQNRYLSQVASSEELTRSNLNTVLLNINGNHFSFARSLEHITSKEKLGEIPASTFGSSPIKKVVEPLIGNIDERKVRNLLSSKRFDVQLCYESALRRNQALKGEMAWQWIVDTRGKISEIELLQSDLTDNKLARCIRKKLASWKFPKARRGSVKIMHKFKFRPIRG